MSHDFDASSISVDKNGVRILKSASRRFQLEWVFRTARAVFSEPAVFTAILCTIVLTILETIYPHGYSLIALVILSAIVGALIHFKWQLHKHGYTIEQFAQYYDHTCGLWATDRPDLVQDPKKVLFRIERMK